MFYLNPEFERKYGRVVVEKDKLQVVLDPNKWGRNIFLEDGIWNVRNDFVAIILGDLLKALGIDVNNKDAQKIRQRIFTISDNQNNIEFLLPQEVKAEHISLEQAKANPYYWTCYLIEGEDPNDLHVTHKFLKEQPAKNVAKILEICDDFWKGGFTPFTSVFDTPEMFGKEKDVHVLLSDDKRFLNADLRDQLDAFCEDQFGAYKPHVTTDEKYLSTPIVGYAFMYGKTPIKTWPENKVTAEAKDEKVLWKNKWLEVYEKDGWYTCVRSTVGDGVCVLPYRKKGDTWEILIRCEHTPCHEDGPRVKGKFNKTSLTGQIEKGYDAIGTAEKELHEESGYTALQKDFIDLGWVYNTKSSPDKCYLFAVNLDGAKDPDEIKGDGTKGEDGAWCEWASIEEALSLPSSAMSTCIAKLCQQHKITL